MANLVDEGMEIQVPGNLADHPQAATRYLTSGTPPWRITVVFQGRIGLRRAKGSDRIVGACQDTDLRPGASPVWGISLVMSGAVLVTDRKTGRSAELTAGGWFRFAGQPDDEIVLHASPGFVEMSVSTDMDLGSRIDSLGLWPDAWQLQAAPDSSITAAGLQLHNALLDPVILDCSLIRRLVHFIDLVRLTPAIGDSRRDSFRERASRLLSAHPQPAFALAHAARSLGLSEQAFRKRFSREFGMPPGRWHLLRRMERAAGMLVYENVRNVARRLGYSDSATFSRQFRMVSGVNPSSLRLR